MSVLTPAGRESVQDAVNYLKAAGRQRYPGERLGGSLSDRRPGRARTKGGANVPVFNPATALRRASTPAGEYGRDARRRGLPLRLAAHRGDDHRRAEPQRDDPGSTTTRVRLESPSYSQALQRGDRRWAAASSAWSTTTQLGRGQGRPHRRRAGDRLGGPAGGVGTGGMRPPRCAVGQCCIGENGRGVTVDERQVPARVPGRPQRRRPEPGCRAGDQGAHDLCHARHLGGGGGRRDRRGRRRERVRRQDHREQPALRQPCTSGLRVVDKNLDGVADTYANVFPGPTVCFDVIPKTNVSVPPTTEPQVFTANIVVTGDSVTTLSTRKVFFLVPPEIPEPPID